MPYGQAYTYVPYDGGNPYMYVYYPAYGWRWLSAPWVYGYGPRPYWGAYGPSHFAWYSRPWFRVGYRGYVGDYHGYWRGSRYWGHGYSHVGSGYRGGYGGGYGEHHGVYRAPGYGYGGGHGSYSGNGGYGGYHGNGGGGGYHGYGGNGGNGGNGGYRGHQGGGNQGGNHGGPPPTNTAHGAHPVGGPRH